MRIRRAVWGATLMCAVVSPMLLPAGPAHAGYFLYAVPTMPSAVVAGQSTASGILSLSHASTPPDEYYSLRVSEIRLAPSCGAAPPVQTVCAQPDPGVFSIAPSASGRIGSACGGISFVVSAPDSTGDVVFS